MVEQQITLYYREGCHLCEEMEDALQDMRASFNFSLERVDIDQNDTLKQKYNADVPVAMYQNKLLFRHFFDEQLFREALKEALIKS